MRRVESEALAKRVYQYHKNVANGDSSVTWLHFKQEGYPRSTIYACIKKYGDSENVTFKKNPGRTAVVATKQKLKAIQELYQRNPAMSIAAAAKKLKMSKSYLGKLKLEKLGIKARTKKAAPKYVKDQEQRVKTACRKLYDQM